MNTPRFLIAKYAPDARRMEPRNFGLIVWNEGNIQSKFIEDSSSGLRRLHIIDMHAYRQWITSWRLQCEKPFLRSKTGETIQRTSPEFLDALRDRTSANFMLFDGGRMLERLDIEETTALVDELFIELVSEEAMSTSKESHSKTTLIRTCDNILAPLDKDSRFHKDLLVTNGVEDDFPPKFTYGFGDPNKPEYLLQAVPLGSDDQVRSAAQKFRAVSRDSHLIDSSRCACLVDSHRGGSVTHNRVSFLSRFSGIVDIGNLDVARIQLARMGLPILAT